MDEGDPHAPGHCSPSPPCKSEDVAGSLRVKLAPVQANMKQPSYAVVTAEGSAPERYMLFLHGILGRGANWRTIARRFVQARPAWGALLVDLRMHGGSLGFPAPHTLEAAAADLRALEAVVPVRGVLGHSFGGKVALAFADGQVLDEIWIIDSMPGVRREDSEDTLTVLSALEGIPMPVPSRDAFIAALGEAGVREQIARWLAMNLERRDDGQLELTFDLRAIRAMLEDYFRRDLWRVIELAPEETQIHVVIGGRSRVFRDEDRERLERVTERNPRVHMHLIANAGHWVHVDAPETVIDLLTREH